MKSLLCIAATGLLLAACGHKNAEDEKVPTSAADSTSSYLTDSVRRMSPEAELTLNGTVTFDQDNVVRVFPLVSGNVQKTTASLGAYVQKGQDLALIRSGDISNYTNDYQADKSDLDVAKQNFKNVEAQYKAGFASQTDYLTAQSNLKKAQDELGKSTNILRVYGGSTAGTGQPYFTVKAPIAGYIVEKNVNTGQDLRSDNQDPLYTISSLQKIWVLANVYEQDIPEIKQNQAVDIQVLAYPDKTFKGIISNVSSVLDEQARVLKVRIVLDNKDGLLKPDMFATIHVHLPNTGVAGTDQALAVAQKAVVFDRDHYYVIVQTGRDKYEVREVKVVKNTTRYAFVEGGNLKPGDTVVTEGSLLLYNDLTD
ncbi:MULTISPECIES: efflux RND transporter periplasmic adaptor subunit [Spirosoma]|uniref:Efflux RND transporter periplasmic adaptor subunit n=1 Tax=Spirosoma liriopis TaxID=2937440 RepID=A0ABT0HPB9_9BACT|nr:MULTISPECIES: efflux RND transporter periplasmic adaptor subunit [Spirosoma]MCK8494023.1 efflux RND transporter periplasmic adaptor subunit [Spirosoma liriopis]UHG89040.1 efflux RND transporter periplasmic adaptor subunit [Spirosoma oryzicola]